MKDHQLKAWLQLAESGSIRAAARDLGISPAAVTKAVRELEADLDAQLVVRSARGIVFTESGRQLHGSARALAQEQSQLARQDIGMLRGGARARVAVAVTPMVFLGVLPEVVRAFRKAMPAARLTLFDGLVPQAVPLLREGRVDFAVSAPAARRPRGGCRLRSRWTRSRWPSCAGAAIRFDGQAPGTKWSTPSG